jgi:UDP:flavonoid glycosyltransferase YjiC (YdhE family)
VSGESLHTLDAVRILFTFIGGRGHLEPLIPIARAAEGAGHTVGVAGSGNLGDAIAAAGFLAFPTSEPRTESREPEPLRKVDPGKEDRDLRENFARLGARRHAAAILELAGRWEPDVVVRDEVDFGAAIAAERLRLPCVSVVVLAAGGFPRKSLVAEPLHALRDAYGLPADPELVMLDGGLVLSPFPRRLRDPEAPLPPGAISFRPGAVTEPSPAAKRPTVYFTLGTVFTPHDLSATVLDGLSRLPVDVIATVGADGDPAAFGPRTKHMRIERYIPQGEVLPTCDLVISHGGSGSIMGALAHGLPSILMPLGADQPYNARRCVALGVAREVEPATVTPEQIRVAVAGMLADERYRRAAERIREEINALPGADQMVPLLERLAVSPT